MRTLALFAWLVIVFLAAGIGGAGSVNSGGFYSELARPSWAPPGWLFGPVWTLLYTLMAVAAWLVWREGGFRVQATALTLFLVQLAANALWTWIFFRWQLGGAAFAEIVALWGMILATLILFWRVKPVAGALLVPYLAWVSFASALCFAIWRLNPGRL